MSPVDVTMVAFRSEGVIEDAVRTASALGGRVFVVDHGDGRAGRLVATEAEATHDPANPGFGAGQNRAVAGTSTPYVLVCNPDADVIPRSVAAGAAILDGRPDVAAVQGVIMNRTTGLPERSAGVELGPLHLVGRALGARGLLRSAAVRAMARRVPALRDHAQRVPEEAMEVESLAATAILVRRAAFDAVGGFDESFFLYGEDLDLCRRLRLAGWKLVALPEVWATHTSGGSAQSSWNREVSWWRGVMHFGARWWSPGAWNVALLASCIRWARLAAKYPSSAREAFDLMVLQTFRSRPSSRAAARPRRDPNYV